MNRFTRSLKATFLLLSPCLAVAMPTLWGQTGVDQSRFEKEVLVESSHDALQLEVLPNGDVVFIEFWGGVKRWNAADGSETTLGRIASHSKGEVGLLGMAVAPDFLESGWIYLHYCPQEKPETLRVSRFTVEGDRIDPESERILLSWPYDSEHVFHMGGALWMDGRGDLYIGTGDNCHYSPGLPVDMRPGREQWDAFRSAANSRDFRGKVLRIHPEPDGGYSIPEGNLFPGGKDGLPEIFVMGVRNPFRISVDNQTGTLFIGDVGPNFIPDLGIEPKGYDEINATSVAANFGWPAFNGPNEALPLMDFDAVEVLDTFDPSAPINPSPNNTGAVFLPEAKPALIWYGNGFSETFPSLGSGGRSIMAGPVYRYAGSRTSPIRLPKALDGRLFIYEWMRNWIQAAELGEAGVAIGPVFPDLGLRRPIDMKFGPDGALYLVEYGDLWWENKDSQISRILYRRGNRGPKARIQADDTAGRQPLTIRFDASGSSDADGDALSFRWTVDGKTQRGRERFSHTFTESGSYEVGLEVRDGNGASDTVTETIQVGNARPEVSFEKPIHGTFFDWEEAIPYQVSVSDIESHEVDEDQVSVQGDYLIRRFQARDEEAFVHPGLALMRESTCFACHLSEAASAGPPYQDVAAKYRNETGAPEQLAQKIISGGAGVWGELPMPPHPQHSIEETRQMVHWILSLTNESVQTPRLGSRGNWKAPKLAAAGSWTAPPEPGEGVRTEGGVLVLTASYTDAGVGDAPPLRGEASVVLHSRRKKAALYDDNSGMEYVDKVEGETGILGIFDDGDSIVWRDMNLRGITRLRVRAGSLADQSGHLEIRVGSPNGPLLARMLIPVTGDGAYEEIQAALNAPQSDLTDVCVVARFDEPDGQLIGLNWIEFINP